MRKAVTLLALAGTITLRVGAQAPVGGAALKVATPTYASDGQVTGATASFPVRLNEPIVVYPHSGASLCLSASAGPRLPTNAGYGWRLKAVPIQIDDRVVVQVDWERLWDGGRQLQGGPGGSTKLTLHPGDQVMLDYLTAVARPTPGNTAPEGGTSACPAVGMGLEIGIPTTDSQTIVETDVWLVRTLPDGREQSQRQTIRTRLGTSSEFFFDDEPIGLRPSPTPTSTTTPHLRTFGRLAPSKIVDGKVQLALTIARGVADAPGQAGSSTFPVTAGPDEVVSFRVPRIVVQGLPTDPLAVRIQVRQLR